MKSEMKYPTETLLQSKALSGYQQDFARVVLKEPEYTMKEARAALNSFFGKDVK
ncbi:hypothetical protein [Oscillibacter sp.]|uniref:hypothetical protein n=1 Tax=Oscillibacter sp. TaxID=1945593 RepID=UPI00289E1217|nr:hypothetical protein [Oscillibacter sp.]